MTGTKPSGLTPQEERAWENTAPGSWQRRALAWAASRREPSRQGGDEAAGVDRVVHRAVLPGEHGLECIFYQYIALRTSRLRRSVYVTVAAEGEEFRPSMPTEHFPTSELSAYQMIGAAAFGKGRRLEVTFVCYSPPDSGTAEEAALEIRTALEELREVATWPFRERHKFGFRCGARATVAVIGDGVSPSYRPPSRSLPYRAGPPAPPPAPPRPAIDQRLAAGARPRIPRVARAAQQGGERVPPMGGAAAPVGEDIPTDRGVSVDIGTAIEGSTT